MNNNIEKKQDDVIDIRELFHILKGRKKLIFLITFLVTIFAILYIWIATPIYEVKSNVRIGYIGKDLIVEPNTLNKTLKLVFKVDNKVETDKPFISEVSEISINKKTINFITIKTKAISNKEALKKNKEVVIYAKNLYKNKINQYIINTKNKINRVEHDISNINNFEQKNIEAQITLLKTQDIASIDEKINFYKNIQLKNITSKIVFHTKKLIEYTNLVDSLYKNNKNNKDTASLAISSMQAVNYQNLILSAQNKIEDFEAEKEAILTKTIPSLNREKKNIIHETIRKLKYKLAVDLVYKKTKLKEKILQYNYQISEQNIRNSHVVGGYIMKGKPVKPKKILIIIIAFITGLILSIFLAFFLEFLQGMKEED